MQYRIYKNKLFLANLVILLVIFAGIILVESGGEPWLDSEKVFMAQLHNSLYYLDQAKRQWMTEKNKPEDAVPTMDDLGPYLGEWKNKIEKLKQLGIEYKLTSSETNQSDVATLTRGIRFRSAFCPYYRAGTTLCIRTGWHSPPLSISPVSVRIQLIQLHADFFLKAAIFILILVDVILLLIQKFTNTSNPATHSTSSNALMPDVIKTRDFYVLIFGCLFCLLGLEFLSLMSLPNDYFIESLGNGLGVFFIGAALLLPILCRRFLMVKRLSLSKRVWHLTGFLISLLPAICILWGFLSAWCFMLPYHVRERDAKRITRGMSETQVCQAIGQPRSSSSGEGKARLTYDLQIAWGRSGRQFLVDLIDNKVVATKIVRYGGEPNDDFWESDFLKDLKSGKAFPSKEEVENACLIICKKELPGTVGVTISNMDLCLRGVWSVQATGQVVEKYAGVSNNLSRPFNILLVKSSTRWHPTEYDLMGIKGTIQHNCATNIPPRR